MKKYAVINGDGVSKALIDAGFYCDYTCLQHEDVPILYIEKGEVFRGLRGMKTETFTNMQDFILLTPSDVLNGKAFELDGAKKPEPRYFLSAVNMDVVKVKNGKNEWMGFNGVAKETSLDIEYLNGNCPELTKSDVAYIRDNASKAKELGMTLRKPVGGDDWLSPAEDKICVGFYGTPFKKVAGHRYCRKVEPKKSGSFCHECGKPVDPKDSNFCKHCGEELSR